MLLNANPQEAYWLYRLKFRTIDTHVRFDSTNMAGDGCQAQSVG